MPYIKNTDNTLTPYMIAHLQKTFPHEYDHILRQIKNENSCSMGYRVPRIR